MDAEFIPRHSQATPTPALRWIERDGQRVLQQKWSIVQYAMIQGARWMADCAEEWRDVPLETHP